MYWNFVAIDSVIKKKFYISSDEYVDDVIIGKYTEQINSRQIFFFTYVTNSSKNIKTSRGL
jgi:hypothetical protein